MPKEIDGVNYFTQEELDGVISERLKRVEKKPDDYDETKQRLAELTEKSAEWETARAEFEQKLEQAQADRDAAIDAAKAEGRAETLPELAKAAVREKAITAKFRDADDALAHVGDINSFIVDGAVDVDAIASRIDEIKTSKSYLVDAGIPSASDAGIGAAGSGSAPEPKNGTERLAGAYSTK